VTIPLWLAQVVAGALAVQFFAVVAWMFRQDKARAVAETKMGAAIDALSGKVDSLAATLEKHNPVLTEASAHALEGRVKKLETDYRRHHSFIRRLQRRMDLARIGDSPDSEADDADDGG